MSDIIEINKLTDVEICLLEQLTYLDEDVARVAFGSINYEGLDFYKISERNVGLKICEILEKFDNNAIANLRKHPEEICDAAISGTEWASIIEQLKTNEHLKDLVLSDIDMDKSGYHTVTDSSGNEYPYPWALCFTDGSESTSAAIIAYKGTTGETEWADNVGAAYSEKTPPQEAALEFATKMSNKYSDITVTGHSKGANKAMYVSVFVPAVTRCVCFDGQGFSAEFYKNPTVWRNIKERASIITNYALSSDFVHILLNHIPGSKQYYCEGYGVDGIMENHSPNSFLQQEDWKTMGLSESITDYLWRRINRVVEYEKMLRGNQEDNPDYNPLGVITSLYSMNPKYDFNAVYRLSEEDQLEYAKELTQILRDVVANEIPDSSLGTLIGLSMNLINEDADVTALHELANHLVAIGDEDMLKYIESFIGTVILTYHNDGSKISEDEKFDALFADPEMLAKIVGRVLFYMKKIDNLSVEYINSLLETFHSDALSGLYGFAIKRAFNNLTDGNNDWALKSIAWTIANIKIEKVEDYISKSEFKNLWDMIEDAYFEEKARYKNGMTDLSEREKSDFLKYYKTPNGSSRDVWDYLSWKYDFIKYGKLIEGDGNNNVILFPDPHSVVLAGKGDDVIYGDNIDNVLVGDAGNDTIFSQNGDDWIFGETGDDNIRVDGGFNHIFGGEGKDVIYGGSNTDYIYGGNGQDTIYGGDGFDTIHGDGDIDTIRGGDGDDTIYGDNGNDTIYGDAGKDTLDGGIGNDTIFGNIGEDTLKGREGNDELNGGFGNDTLLGGDNSDTYHFYKGGDHDEIYDKYGSNTIIFDNLEPTDLTISYAGENQKDLIFTITSTSDTLTILDFKNTSDNFKYKFGDDSDSYTIEDNDGVLSFSKIEGGPSGGGYGSHWEEQHNDTGSDNSSRFGAATVAQPPRDPLVIDLGTPGINLSTVETGIHFDIDKNGFAEKTVWTDGEDGFLVLDRNGNDIIDDGGELFSDHVIMSDGRTSSDGFEALADLDEDYNGIIDAKDSRFTDLRVWIDSVRDGFSAEDELKTLAELGITSIVLPTDDPDSDDDEVEFIKTGSVIFEDGVRDIQEHWFEIDGADTQEITVNNVENDLTSFGNMHSLSYALEHYDSGELQNMVDSFKDADSFIDRRKAAREILYFITDSTDITVNSRGGTIDARNLHVLETIMGVDTFVGVNGSTNPNSTAASILNQLFTDFDRTYFNLLNKVLGVADYLEMIEEEPNENGDIVLNLTPVEEVVDHYISLGVDVHEMLYNIGIYIRAC